MTENENNRGWQWLLPISLVADISAVVTVLAGSASVLWLVLGSVALLLGLGQVFLKLGKPVDKMVLLAVLGIVLGTTAITAVATRSALDTSGQAAGSTTSSQTSSTTPSGTTQNSPTGATTPTTPTTPSFSSPPAPTGVKRETVGDKPIMLTAGYSLDLDSAAPDWVSVLTTGQTTETEDIYFLYESLHARKHLALVKTEPTRDDCVRAGYQDAYSSNRFEAGSWFCVKTSEDTYGRVKVRVKEYGKLALDVLVWETKKS